MPAVFTTNHQWYRTINRTLKLLAGVTAASGGGGVTRGMAMGPQFVVGNPGVPGNGTTTFNSPALAGKDIAVFKNGVGFMQQGIDYTVLPTGGIELVPPAVFTTGELWVVFEKNP